MIDQINRLNSGRTAPDKFDFAFLRFRAGRYGKEALQRLGDGTEGPRAPLFAERAKDALRADNEYRMRQSAQAQPTPALRASNIAVTYPAGAALPDDFLRADWNTAQQQLQLGLPGCLLRDAKCEAILIDLDGDGRDEILLFSLPFGPSAAFRSNGEGRWSMLGAIANGGCPGVREALRAGKFEAILPTMKEIEVAGQRLSVNNGCRPAPR